MDSRGRGYGYSPGESSMTDLGFRRARWTPVEMCAVDSNSPRASFPPGELCAEGRDYNYAAGFVDRIASVYLYGALPVRSCSFLGGLTNSRTSQLVDGGPVSVGRTCMPTFW